MSHVQSALGTSKHQAPSTQTYPSPNLSVGTINTPIDPSTGIVQCMVFGHWRSWRNWRTGLLGVEKCRGVGAYLLANFSVTRSSVFTAAERRR